MLWIFGLEVTVVHAQVQTQEILPLIRSQRQLATRAPKVRPTQSPTGPSLFLPVSNDQCVHANAIPAIPYAESSTLSFQGALGMHGHGNQSCSLVEHYGRVNWWKFTADTTRCMEVTVRF
jgi:hypothetical protein